MSNMAAIEASMNSHRPRSSDVASTAVGQIAAEAKDSILVPVVSIRPSPYQSRAQMDEAHIEELMASIAESGLLTPILLRKLPKDDASGEVSNFDTFYELVAGHNRLEACRRLGREHIPGIVRPLSNREAARALTVENTHHRTLTDWELFKHSKMLRDAGAVKNVTDLAGLLGVGRTHVYNLDSFALLPAAVVPLLDKAPALMGGRLAYDLAAASMSHPAVVSEAIHLLADGKLKQSGVAAWVERHVNPPATPYRKEVAIHGAGSRVKLIITEDGAKVSGDLDYDRLQALIEENLSTLLRP